MYNMENKLLDSWKLHKKKSIISHALTLFPTEGTPLKNKREWVKLENPEAQRRSEFP